VVPAILEYLPYRWGDATYARDYCRHPYVCGHGFACVRVDLRGSGDSEGEYHGEYLAQEQADCLHVLEWIAAQPWCNGAVGMYGKSWGGFNGLQMASLRPAHLRSVVSLYSTDDRYATDVHYQGGAIVACQMLSWSSVMFSYDARPPNPLTLRDSGQEEAAAAAAAGEEPGAEAAVRRARAAWRRRLGCSRGPCAPRWLGHPLRDAFWQHGSVASVGVGGQRAIDIPVLLIGGASDGYTDTVFRMLASQPAAQRGRWRCLVGPWGHDWPDVAAPSPNIGYLQVRLPVRPILTEIYLCDACSCHEITRWKRLVTTLAACRSSCSGGAPHWEVVPARRLRSMPPHCCAPSCVTCRYVAVFLRGLSRLRFTYVTRGLVTQ
jgi:putative CocE/NonD family hydrolase